MATPFAKEVGAVGIRALPITDNFRRDLLKKLRVIEKQVNFRVHVNRARVDRSQLRRSIQTQLEGLSDFRIDVNANTTAIVDEVKKAGDKGASQINWIDDVMLRRLRQQIERGLRDIEITIRPDADDDGLRDYVNRLRDDFETLSGKLADDIMSPEDAAQLRHRLNQISDEIDEVARNRETRIDANPFTSWASARLAWLTRPRTVEIIPRVSKAAVAKALTALSALSGARLSYDYLRRFSDYISEIDLKMPKLTFSTLGLTTAFAALMGTISGIVGIGDGLAATLPSFLLLPGLLAGAVMSGVALFVALKESKDQLAELGPDYTNLGRIIKKAFWDVARPAIISFSNSIMPQLERSFKKTSAAIGRFTAGLSGSFEREFAGGRLEAMFDGLAAAWDELTTGTDAFAGAITNLGLVAARYMPRLARWFVRLSITFDNWLSDVSTDGRLDQWIEESIDAYYALWDVLAATTGIFQGLWKAAEAGGGGGLRGFADMLLRWEEAINDTRWQRTLTALFRGSGVALSGIGDGLDRFGLMVDKLRHTLEYFVGAAGEALGRFIGKVSDALAQVPVEMGIRDFIDGVSRGLKGLEPALKPVARLLAEIAGFVGDLAGEVGGLLGRIGKDLAPQLEDIFSTLREELPELVDRAEVIWEKLQPAVETLAEDLDQLIPIVVELTAVLEPLADLISGPLAWLWSNTGAGSGIDALDSLRAMFDEFEKSGDATAAGWAFADAWREADTTVGNLIADFLYGWSDFVLKVAVQWEKLKVMFRLGLAALESMMKVEATKIMASFLVGLEEKFPGITDFIGNIGPEIQKFIANPAGWLTEKGAQVISGFKLGLTVEFLKVTAWVARIKGQIQSVIGNPFGWLYNSGKSLIEGFIAGIQAKIAWAKVQVALKLAEIRDYFPFSPAKEGPFSGRGWVTYSGQAVGSEFGRSIADSLGSARRQVAAELAAMQAQFSFVGSASAAGSAGNAGIQPGGTVRLVVGAREFDGYVEELAGGLVRTGLSGASSAAATARLGARRPR